MSSYSDYPVSIKPRHCNSVTAIQLSEARTEALILLEAHAECRSRLTASIGGLGLGLAATSI